MYKILFIHEVLILSFSWYKVVPDLGIYDSEYGKCEKLDIIHFEKDNKWSMIIQENIFDRCIDGTDT